MVFYYTTGDFLIYMGRDKYENEELLKHAWPEDVWFHVDNYSSAHVYLRLKKGMTLENIPEEALVDCSQLVKANSIQASKLTNIIVVYTMFGNLKKTQGMDIGQVGFYSEKEVRRISVEKKLIEVVKRLEKTEVERNPNLREEKEKRDQNEKAAKKVEQKEKVKEAMRLEEAKIKEAEIKNYSSVMVEANMKSNREMEKQNARDYEDNFM